MSGVAYRRHVARVLGECFPKHDWECWWTEDVDVCRDCEKEQRCRHKNAPAREADTEKE